MSAVSALTSADARLLIVVAKAIVAHPRDLTRLVSPLILASRSPRLSFANSLNILRLLLTYTSPVAADSKEISELASAILHAEEITEISESDLVEDTESLSLWICSEFAILVDEPEDAVIQTAKDLLVHLATRAHQLSFTISVSDANSKAALFAFAKARCLQMAHYYEDVVSVAQSFECLRNYGPFEAWYHGIIQSYSYFHQNYAAPRKLCSPQYEFLCLENYSSMFNFLVVPLERDGDDMLASKLSASPYFTHVILPLAAYNESDLTIISDWMSAHHSACNSLSEFEFWEMILKTILSFHNNEGQRFTENSYDGIVRLYMHACLYFGIYRGESLTPFAQAKIQTQIRDTLLYLAEMLGKVDAPSSVTAPFEVSDYETLEDFAAKPPEFVRLIFETDLKACLDHVLRIFSTCCSLHSLNQLTVRKFFQLKSQATLDTKWFHKEVMQIVSGADSLNYDQIMSKLTIFSEAFLSHNTEAGKKLDQIVFENFIQTEQFEKALKYLHAVPSERKIDTELTFRIVYRKFWDLFENASNLDDRIGKLKIATSCLEILESLSGQAELSGDNRAAVVKVKHLMKAIHSLKNFKLVIVKNQPVTPKQVLDTVLSASTEDKHPQFAIITMILEQNPKSYLAHERLYKIVNDLAIYAGLDVSVVSFLRIQSACVESALIDGNFDFAYRQSKALITHCVDSNTTENFGDIWLMFYQVGKYILPEWFGDYDAKIHEEKIRVLLKQREILSFAIKYTKPNAFRADNSRLLVGQFRHVNMEIKKWHEEAELHRSEDVQDAFQSTQKNIQENLTDLINEASHSQKQASEKISNLFVSGLGWAIGAKR